MSPDEPRICEHDAIEYECGERGCGYQGEATVTTQGDRVIDVTDVPL